MQKLRKLIRSRWFAITTTILFFALIFLLAYKPANNLDTFFHVKVGEEYLKYGLLHRDVFSYVDQHREWFPYEWLFQITVFEIQHYFSYSALSIFVSLLTVTQVALLFVWARKTIPMLWNFLLCFMFLAWDYIFFVARPQTVAMVCFIFTFVMIFHYIKTNRNFLWTTLFFSYILANLHGSIVFSVYLFFAYACACFALCIISKNTIWLHKAKTIFFFGLGTFLVSLLPPIGLTQYHLLFIFLQHLHEVQKLDLEWASLGLSLAGQEVYLAILLIGLIPFLFLAIKRKLYADILLASPLFIFLLLPYSANRNLSFAFICIFIFWVWSAGYTYKSKFLQNKIVIILVFFLLLSFHVYLLHTEKATDYSTYDPPTQVIHFLLTHHINGNIYYSFSGDVSYFVYRLFPTYKLFSDTQVDMFLCCEIPRYEKLMDSLSVSQTRFTNVFNTTIISPYNISFIVLFPSNDPGDVKIWYSLVNNPQWSLVYWDDKSAIFVRKDGKNTKIIKQFGATTATPYSLTPIRSGSMYQTAFSEYTKMIVIADSARSRNALGDIYLKEKKYSLAQQEFEKAIQRNPAFDSEYANLGELAYFHGDTQTAIAFYQKAQNLDPSRGFIYIRLAQFYAQIGDIQNEQDTLETGLKNDPNKQDQKDFQNQLNQLP